MRYPAAPTPAEIAWAARANRLPGVLWLEHDGVAGLLEDLTRQPIGAREPKLDDERAVLEFGEDGPFLTSPARPFGRDPHAGAARRRHLAGAGPAVDVGRRVDVGARLERLVGHGART